MITGEFKNRVLPGLAVAAIVGCFTMFVALFGKVSENYSWRTKEWPLEQMLLLTEHQQLQSAIAVNQAELEELSAKIENLERELWSSKK